jgi:hypothetical protein
MTERPPASDEPVNLNDLIAHVLLQHPTGDALQHLGDAVQASQRIGEAADHLIGHFVDEARAAGASWTEIGANMGVTKQAAQKRFVPKDSEDPDFPDRGPLNRFTPRARNVVKNAKSSAAMLGHSHVTNETLLLGLITEPEGLAAQALVAAGDQLDQLRDAILANNKRSRRRAVGDVRFSGESKKTLELALRTALSMNHNYIGTEHLLLGILKQPKDPATKLLAERGITLATAEPWLAAELDRILKARKAG